MSSLFEKPLPAEYREELRQMMAPAPPRPAPRRGSLLLFQLGPLKLALSTKVASAVSPVLHIGRIPHRSGTVLLGLVAFRGGDCAVLQLGSAAGRDAERDGRRADADAGGRAGAAVGGSH